MRDSRKNAYKYGFTLAGLALLGFVTLQFVGGDAGVIPLLTLLLITPLLLFILNLRNYRELLHLLSHDPLLRIGDDGLSLWNSPDYVLSWWDIDGFQRKASKIYAFRFADRSGTSGLELMCVDTALLDIRREDLEAYLNRRLDRQRDRISE